MPMIRVIATLLVAAFVLSCNPSAPKFAFKHAERRGKLESNGLRFVLMPDDTTQLTQVDIRYDVGSREDPQGRAGMAHLVEHLMFQTRPDGPNTAPMFDTIINLATEYNAYTNWDTTHYYMTSHAENLDAMLKIEAMRLYYGCQNIPVAEFEREREVVRNEIRWRSSAEQWLYSHALAAIYPKGHAYERMIGGNDEQIANATLDEACAFMKKYYTPDRATLLIAGAFDVDGTVGLIQKWFAKIPKGTPGPRVAVQPFTVEHGRKEIEAEVERPSVWVGWVLPPLNTPEGEYAQFGLGNAFARIARAGQKYEFAYSVRPRILGGHLAPLFLVEIQLKGLGKLEEALEFAQKAAKQAHRGIDEGTYEQLEEEKNRAKAAFIEQLERLPSRTGVVANMVQFATDFDFDSSDMYLFHQLDKYAKFDGAKVAAAVKKVLAWEKAAIVVVKPSTKGLSGDKRSAVKFAASGDHHMAAAPVDPAEAKRPLKTGKLKSFEGLHRFKLGNGMDVMILPIKSMPLVAAQLLFRNVGDASTPNSPLLAYAAADFLTLPLDAEAFARTGVDVNCGTSEDVMGCFTSGVNIYLDVMLKGLERKVRGDYHQDQIESWQKQAREQLKLKTEQEQNEYVRQVYTSLYGADHPYTKTATSSADAIGKLGRDALDSFRDSYYSAANATLVVVGDFDPKYAESQVRSVFGGWGSGTAAKPVTADVPKRTGATYVGVVSAKPGEQVGVTIAYPAPAGIDGQEGARQVLAGMLAIRAADIRFKLGSTYGLSFGRQPHVGPTAYMLAGGGAVGGTVDAQRAGESIKALRDSIDALRNGEGFEEDFVRARRKIVSNLLGESTVTSELASRLSRIATYGLDTNYYNTLLQQVSAVSPAQVRALLKTELDPAKEVIVLLGDRDHVNKAFADVGIKDVKIVEPDYK
jgi:zinc protease